MMVTMAGALRKLVVLSPNSTIYETSVPHPQRALAECFRFCGRLTMNARYVCAKKHKMSVMRREDGTKLF